MVGHLVVDATPKHLDKTLAKLRADGVRLNINLLGEAVLGEREANRRLQGTRELLARDDVDYVSIKVSSVASQLSMWGFDETVARVVERLTPLYEQARRIARRTKFINLDMEEYRDLHLTIAVFTRLLEQPQMQHLEAGIVLQAYLPDAVAALEALTGWAHQRRARRRRRHQGAHRQGREPRDGARRRDGARLAARHLVDASRSPTPTTSACSCAPSRPRTPPSCASASPATTCSTSPSPGCSPSAAA